MTLDEALLLIELDIRDSVVSEIEAQARAKGWTIARTIEQAWTFYREQGGSSI